MAKKKIEVNEENPAQIYELPNGKLVQLLCISKDLLTGDTYLSVMYGKEDEFKNFVGEKGVNVRVHGILVDIPNLLQQL